MARVNHLSMKIAESLQLEGVKMAQIKKNNWNELNPQTVAKLLTLLS